MNSLPGPILRLNPRKPSFDNLTGEKDQKYFSDLLTEEIINLLANVFGLRGHARGIRLSWSD